MKNKEIIYEYLWKESVASGKIGWKTTEVADALHMQRTNVSSLLNTLVQDGRLEKSKTRPVIYSVAKQKQEDVQKKPFDDMVGCDGSLKKAVEKANKFMMYPSEGLNIQVVSEAGAGATTFCRNLYYTGLMNGRFGVGTPYVYVNCRHFRKNYHALNAVLFGDDSNVENSAFAKARGGLLFLDHMELLAPDQYGRISDFLETGCLKSQVLQQSLQVDDLVFVFSMDSYDECQVDWRNLVTIHLPDMDQRPYVEKLNLLLHFFQLEAQNAGCQLRVDVDVIRLLTLAHFSHGVKGISNAIKAACTNAYVRVLDQCSNIMHVAERDLSSEVKASIRPVGDVGAEIDSYFGTANYLTFGSEEEDDHNVTEVYQQLKDQYCGMMDRGVASSVVQDIISAYLQHLHFDMPNCIQGMTNIHIGQLSQVVDQSVINYVGLFAEKYKKEYDRELPDRIFCGLCLHIQGILKKDSVSEKRIDNEQVKAIIQQYPREYATMLDFAYVLYERFYIRFSVEETALLTMFLIDIKEENENPVVLYAMHGPGVAMGLATVANQTVGADNAYALEMQMEEDHANIAEQLENKIREIHRGGGVLVFYDTLAMESMLDSISEKCNIKLRGMYMPIMTLGITAARNCKCSTDLEEAFHNLKKTVQQERLENRRPKAIITLCHTSEGGADQLKKYIDKYSKLEMQVFALAMSNREKLAKEIMEIKKAYSIHAFVGTFDPEICGIPFISIADVFECSKADLDHVLMFETVHRKYEGYEKVIENYGREAKYLSEERLRKYVPDVVEKLAVAYDLDGDERVGLCAHMVYMLDALRDPDYRPRGGDLNMDRETYAYDFKMITQFIKPLEKQFHIVICDEEISILLRILRKQKTT